MLPLGSPICCCYGSVQVIKVEIPSKKVMLESQMAIHTEGGTTYLQIDRFARLVAFITPSNARQPFVSFSSYGL